MSCEALPWDEVKEVKCECVVCGAKLTGGKELFVKMRSRNLCPVCQVYGSTQITVTYRPDIHRILENQKSEG